MWFIEDPDNKRLVKTCNLSLAPQSEQSVIVVMKAPSDRVQMNIVTYVYVRLLDEKSSHTHLEKKLSGGSELENIEFETQSTERKVETEMSAFILGRLENVKIQCMREIYNEETQCNIIPLGIKRNEA